MDSNKISILIISPTLGRVSRGAETFTYEFVKCLSEKYRVTLVLAKKMEFTRSQIRQIELIELNDSLTLKKYTEVVAALRKSKNIFVKIFLRLINFIYYLLPEVIEAHLLVKRIPIGDLEKSYDVIFPQNGIAGVKFCKKNFPNVPFIYTGHGGIGRGEELILQYKPKAYIAISTPAYEWSTSRFPNIDTYMVPNGVIVEDFEIPGAKKKKHILSVGALEDFKRHELTIKAVALLEDEEVTLEIIGDGSLRSSLQILADKLLPNRCKIHKVRYTEMPKIYSTASIFVLPSLNEPMGIVYLEAMSAGMSVVAPDDKTRREIMGPFAIYVDVVDIKKYSEAIQKAICNNLDRSAMRDYVYSKYSWDKVITKYENLINNVLRLNKVKNNEKNTNSLWH